MMEQPLHPGVATAGARNALGRGLNEIQRPAHPVGAIGMRVDTRGGRFAKRSDKLHDRRPTGALPASPMSHSCPIPRVHPHSYVVAWAGGVERAREVKPRERSRSLPLAGRRAAR